ncbi:hypothetical protein Leryth_005702 [Lithospermum erythrorhizon]|nr:hypothetical protein Leryth_005702 [Lithospermum erythrorhizon]
MQQNTVPEEAVGDNAYLPIPRGGPIFVPDMVSPLTKVSDCELAIFQELQNLEGELDGDDAIHSQADEISVDELKIITEEELVDKALKEVESTVNVGGEGSGNGLDGVGSESTKSLQIAVYDGKKPKRQVKRKSHGLDESYMAKVEELARIKQQQDEDKRAAKLHSFNGSLTDQGRGTISMDKSLKMTSLRGTNSTKAKTSNAREHVQVHYPEVVLCIEVYHNHRAKGKAQEFLVLGRQLLTEVRDRIYCLTDEIMNKAGQSDPSGYFLIEDVFCNDLREPLATDYSRPIIDWLKNSKDEAQEKWDCIMSGELHQKQKALLGSVTGLQLPRFRTMDMKKTRFCDLRFRLGAGYLYCHQGDCKHMIVIRDMRLIHPEDVQNRAAYPLVTYQSKLRFHKCSVCKIFKAQKFTVDDKWSPENPCYFCDLCYYMLHYVDGALHYNDFSVYDYFHE